MKNRQSLKRTSVYFNHLNAESLVQIAHKINMGTNPLANAPDVSLANEIFTSVPVCNYRSWPKNLRPKNFRKCCRVLPSFTMAFLIPSAPFRCDHFLRLHQDSMRRQLQWLPRPDENGEDGVKIVLKLGLNLVLNVGLWLMIPFFNDDNDG